MTANVRPPATNAGPSGRSRKEHTQHEDGDSHGYAKTEDHAVQPLRLRPFQADEDEAPNHQRQVEEEELRPFVATRTDAGDRVQRQRGGKSRKQGDECTDRDAERSATVSRVSYCIRAGQRVLRRMTSRNFIVCQTTKKESFPAEREGLKRYPKPEEFREAPIDRLER
jgi:hypothetical protein